MTLIYIIFLHINMDNPPWAKCNGTCVNSFYYYDGAWQACPCYIAWKDGKRPKCSCLEYSFTSRPCDS